MRLHVGRTAIKGDLGRYARRFNLVELRSDRGSLPRTSRLREWRKAAPEGFVFSLCLPAAVTDFDAPPEQAATELDHALKAARALRAEWLVLRTGARATPSSRTKRRLAELANKIPKDEGYRLAWEPTGLWELEDAFAVAEPLGIHVVADAAQTDLLELPVLYTRLRALGGAARLTAGAAEKVAAALAGAEEAFVAIEGQGAAQGARILHSLLDELGTGDDEDDDDASEAEEAAEVVQLEGGGRAAPEDDLDDGAVDDGASEDLDGTDEDDEDEDLENDEDEDEDLENDDDEDEDLENDEDEDEDLENDEDEDEEQR